MVWVVSYRMTNALWEIPWVILSPLVLDDLRTVNHNGTFYALELYAFVNVTTVLWSFRLNQRRSPYRCLVPVLGCGEPAAVTFIFTFSEVFSGFEDMPDGAADTLLALVWTQHQHLICPLIFGYVGVKLLHADWEEAARS